MPKKGYKITEQHRQNLKKSHMGQISYNKGRKFTEKHRENLSKSHAGLIMGDDARKNLSISVKKSWEKPERRITKKRKRTSYVDTYRDIRHSALYYEWRKKVFLRDAFICKLCGKAGGDLNAHHKNKTFKELTIDMSNNLPLMSLYDASIIYTPLWDVENGITLCKKCHMEIHKRRNKSRG